MTHSTVRPGLALAALTVSALLAACSSSSSTSTPTSSSSSSNSSSSAPAAAGPATGSCGVITAAEASAALGGQPVKGPRLGNAYVEGGKACVYYGPSIPLSASPNIPFGDTVRVVLVTGPNAKKYFDDYRSKVNAQTITGLGDQAFYDGYASISVLKGDAYVRIAVGVAKNLAPEEMLARDALPRM